MSFDLGKPPEGPPPYQPWTSRHLKIVECAIVVAWQQLLARPEFATWAASAVERDITVELQARLIQMLNTGEVHGFTAAVFAPPIRGQEVDDYSGNRKEKRPDLTFLRLAARPVSNHHAQFYECKVIGRGRTVDDYHNDGVMRFVDGRYAWGMAHAGMIAYVSSRPPLMAATALESYWTTARQKLRLAGLPASPLKLDQTASHPISISVHSRGFRLSNLKVPGDITLRHLWLPTLP